MTEQLRSSTNSIRLLFLGCFETDRRIKSFARFFSRIGFQVEIIFAEPAKNTFRTWTDGGITFTQISLRRSSGPLMFLEYHRKLSKHLSSLSNSNITFACDLYSLSVARKVKKQGQAQKVIYDARELYTELPTVASKPFVKLFWKLTEKRGLIVTDRIIVTAPLDADAIKNVHGFLPHSVLVRNLPEPSEEFEKSNYLRERYPVIGTRRILVYAGGLQIDRGLEEMIVAMTNLQREYAFVIIGSGSLLPKLQEMVLMNGLETSVHFHEAVHSDQLPSILSSADVGITLIKTDSGSYKLALPSKVFEYMQAGLPILSSKLKQVISLFPNESPIKYVEVSSDGILHGLKELSFLSNDSDVRRNISQTANLRFSFDNDAHSLIPFLNA